MKCIRIWNSRRLRQLAGVFSLALLSSGAQAQYAVERNGRALDDIVRYSIGGGYPVSMSRAPGMQSYRAGVAWNSNLICGDMSLTTTLTNQLNGLTDGFQTIMSQVIQNATAAVASLPALIIQRADPGLYNLLTNGVLQARLDFDRSKLTCRAIADRMATIAEGHLGWDQLAEGMALKDTVASTDAVSAIEEAETTRGNNGVPWVGGNNAGGVDQEAIRIVGDVTRAGYNLLNARVVTDTTLVDPGVCNNLTCQTWPSPEAAADWAVRVLGEKEQRTCDACTKTETIPGVGLPALIQEEYDVKLAALQALVTGAQPPLTENLAAAGSNAMPVTREVIEALRDETDQEFLTKRLASEVALSSVVEKALLLQRTLLTGRKEPNVAANQLAQDDVARESQSLEREINDLTAELQVRRTLSANSPMTIIERQRARSEASRGIFDGDTERNRLDRIQQPATNPPP
jgi:integrating conjugative element protein (TIGR03755 family)